jgi:hypothetical protein
MDSRKLPKRPQIRPFILLSFGQMQLLRQALKCYFRPVPYSIPVKIWIAAGKPQSLP